MILEELDYQLDPKPLFHLIKNEPFAILLESNYKNNKKERYDILSCDPKSNIINIKGHNYQHKNQSLVKTSSDICEFIANNVIHNSYCTNTIPFTGGAIGYISYDYSFQNFNIKHIIPDDIKFPIFIVGIYEWAIVTDHYLKKAFYINNNNDYSHFEKIKKLATKSKINTIQEISIDLSFKPSMVYQDYKEAFINTQKCIDEGEYYQINLSQRFESDSNIEPFDIYTKYSNMSQSGFHAYMATPYGNILSLSPERFISVNNNIIKSSPIKGTSSVQNTNLCESKKDRAENLMIVDLTRHDLYKSCISSSINVDKFCEHQSFSGVSHLISTITGKLKSTTNPFLAFISAFPGGSVTGAPKRRTIELSEQTEHRRRSIFCGSIFYYSYNQTFDSNIIIRTILQKENKLYTWCGGGITTLSDCEEEYKEILLKLKSFTGCNLSF